MTLTTRLLITVTMATIALAQQRYESTYDDLDVGTILGNSDLRESYYACFMDTAPCPTDAAVFFKSKAPEAFVASCKYCTDKQLIMFEKIISWYVNNSPDQWNSLVEKTIQDAKSQGLQFR
ncbi:uncharacterized protein LOC106642287 [Copidosoma floridanum]|uniref:uncharacterized protein LOC106642287 n=1 Tax=Copidosoma floridanum TaxID=29053 RepID=UPI0006C9CE88|nr:uncharacterized protein LOC106642287 [Copidosoma floridanum]